MPEYTEVVGAPQVLGALLRVIVVVAMATAACAAPALARSTAARRSAMGAPDRVPKASGQRPKNLGE